LAGTAGAAGQRGTCQAMTAMDSSTASASAQNSGRQPASGTSHCTGNVDATMPRDPVMSIHELARSWAVGSNHRRKPVRGAIRHALTPTPHSTRAASKPEKLVASENARQPATATPRNARITFLGPWRSSQVPSGSCVAAKPRK
jgi:hypothetical protein